MDIEDSMIRLTLIGIAITLAILVVIWPIHLNSNTIPDREMDQMPVVAPVAAQHNAVEHGAAVEEINDGDSGCEENDEDDEENESDECEAPEGEALECGAAKCDADEHDAGGSERETGECDDAERGAAECDAGKCDTAECDADKT